MDESNNNYSNGRPTALSSQHPTTTIPMSPLRLDHSNDNHLNLQSPTLRREEYSEFPTPESTPPPTSAQQPPQQEEKKRRWGLGSKKKDKK